MRARFSLRSLFILYFAACAPQEAALDRQPVVKTVRAGALLLRVYASPTSTGGAATQFHWGESIYLVNTLENATGKEIVCEPDYSDLLEREVLSGYPCAGSRPRRFIKRDGETLWDDEQPGMICPLSLEEYPVWFPAQITIPADFLLRSYIRVNRNMVLDAAEYVAEWDLRGGANDLEDAALKSKEGILCSFPREITKVSVPITVRPLAR